MYKNKLQSHFKISTEFNSDYNKLINNHFPRFREGRSVSLPIPYQN